MIASCRTILLAASALGVSMAAPAHAQDTASAAAPAAADTGNDIIVTAQRVEQRLQDVPISITVFDQAKLTNNNITSAKDLTLYTPNLQANNRYGADNTTFTIRGFTQDLRTYSTVGVFFADVVLPRGSGATQGGNGAGPGQLFDLQNVQVLKGPQGTLFGRNVTGGAVLLVPRKPVDKFEGYVEGSVGDYGMWRAQAALNAPITDTWRIRVGFDHMKRDGYLKNIGHFGDGKYGNHGLGDVDYWAVRFSSVADLTPDLENYTIVSYAHSKSNGVIPKIIGNGIKPDPRVAAGTLAGLGNGYITGAYPNFAPPVPSAFFYGKQAAAQSAREAGHKFWTVENRLPDAASVTETWQIINTTTFRASDELTVKGILSYGEYRGTLNLDLFGNYFIGNDVNVPTTIPFGSEQRSDVFGFAFTHDEPTYGHTNAQSSFIAELQFQGSPGDGRLTWQGGGYVELNDPLGWSGVNTASFTACTDITQLVCTPGTTGSFSVSKTRFRDYAVYGQFTFNITDQLALTAGARYTWDKTRTQLINMTTLFGSPPNTATALYRCSNPSAPGYSGLATFPYTYVQRFTVCNQGLRQNSDKPTWLVDLDYKPIQDLLLYAKWSRGYRQGGLAIFGPDPIQAFEPESVDTYEVGGKASWRGAVPGYFNIAGFYNNFRNQQLSFGVACVPSLPGFTIPCAGNAAIINAGKSRLYGVEVEAGITLFESLRLDASYGYLNSKLQRITIPAAGSLPPYNSFTPPVSGSCIGIDCNVIPNSGPPHKLVLSANYTLPLPESFGRLSIGGVYAYSDRYRAVTDGIQGSNIGMLPSSEVVNLNVNWENAAGLPVDAAFFVTNLTNEHLYQHANSNELRGFASYFIGEPRMYGFRLRYKFGE